VLIDWSEKLSLEPNNSGTGTQYKVVGVLVAVCLRRVGDAVVAETCVGIYDEPNNDVPHTHALLREILDLYASEAKLVGATLRHVNFWSDGGQNHFKSGEALAYLTHLYRFLRQLGGEHMAWNFMQSYHGKGPYDAEGGVVKYRIRRRILEQGFAFEHALAVFEFASRDNALTKVELVLAGIGRDGSRQGGGAVFEILRRRFFHFPESSITSKWCTSPRFFTGSAKAKGPLKNKSHVFCIRPKLNPLVRVMGLLPAALGLTAEAGGNYVTDDTAYAVSTLNYVGDEGFGGTWRRFSCSCAFCLFLPGGMAFALMCLTRS
jgi:hypothetical protein